MVAKAWATVALSSTTMPAGACGRLLPLTEEDSGTRQAPAWEAANASCKGLAPEKNARCCGPAPLKSAKSLILRVGPAPAGRTIPAFSQICASVNGPRFLKKRGSAILFLRRRGRLRVQVDLEGRQLLVQPVDHVSGNVELALGGKYHRLLVQHDVGAAFLDNLLQDGAQRIFHRLLRLGERGLELLVLALGGALQRLRPGLESSHAFGLHIGRQDRDLLL